MFIPALLSGPWGSLIKWGAGVLAVVTVAGGLYLYGHHKGYTEANDLCSHAADQATIHARDLQIEDLKKQIEAGKVTTKKVDDDHAKNQTKVDQAKTDVEKTVKPTDTGIDQKTIDTINAVRNTHAVQEAR